MNWFFPGSSNQILCGYNKVTPSLYEQAKVPNRTFKGKDKFGELSLDTFKTHYKSTAIKTILYLKNNVQKEQQNWRMSQHKCSQLPMATLLIIFKYGNIQFALLLVNRKIIVVFLEKFFLNARKKWVIKNIEEPEWIIANEKSQLNRLSTAWFSLCDVQNRTNYIYMKRSMVFWN